jgi:hypothetical protein
VFSGALQTDLFRPSLVHSVSVLQYYTFLYSTFHTAMDLMYAEVEIIKKLEKGEKLANLDML